ncbi:MAG: hypothetical protein KDA79_14965 [Planctomycetaceae bacterium]|nr:hypothetical protein [Planctomycetaceae bacterium]
MHHFLITRFNVRQPFMARLGAANHYQDKEWLEKRVDLFQRYCWPSVRRQKCGNFIWLVFFDSSTPGWLRRKVEEWSVLPQFNAVFVDGFDDEVVDRSIKEHSQGKHDRVITSRLDSDDMIGSSFIRTVQSVALKAGDGFVDLRGGFQYQDGAVYRISLPYNPFISWISPPSDIRSVISFRHNNAPAHGSVIEIDNGRHWIQVLHAGNLANELFDSADRHPAILSPDAGLTLRCILTDRGVKGVLADAGFAVRWVITRVWGRMGRYAQSVCKSIGA